MACVYYLRPSSFCFGVKRSIEELIKIREKHSHDTIYCIHAIVHNPKITNYFIDRWIIFVENIEEVPTKDAIVVFSAHGVNREIFNKASLIFKSIYNLECPFVTKIYNEIKHFLWQGITQFLYIWKEWHQEAKNVIENIIYQWWTVHTIIKKDDISTIPFFSGPFAILSQTTLNANFVQELIQQIQIQFPLSLIPKVSDICRATYERQWVIQKFSSEFDTLVVIWGKESSNTKELCTIWHETWKTVFFGEWLSDLLKNSDFINQQKTNVAVTGWASTPVEDILEILDWYEKKWYNKKILEFN